MYLTPTADVLVEGLCFPEGPRWHEDKLWFSDIYAYEVRTVDLAGKVATVAGVPGRPSGLGWLPDGRLLIVSMTDRRLLRLDPQGATEVADLSGLSPFFYNDMVVDRHGRAYVGNFAFDLYGDEPEPALGGIALVTPQGETRVVADELAFPNDMAITPDGATLIVGETFTARFLGWPRGYVPDGIVGRGDSCLMMPS